MVAAICPELLWARPHQCPRRAGVARVRNRGTDEGVADCTNALKPLSVGPLLAVMKHGEPCWDATWPFLRSHPPLNAQPLAAESEQRSARPGPWYSLMCLPCSTMTTLAPPGSCPSTALHRSLRSGREGDLMPNSIIWSSAYKVQLILAAPCARVCKCLCLSESG